MNEKEAAKRVEELRDLLKRSNEAYYNEAKPFISDHEFDKSLKELEELEKRYNLVTPDSPTQRVGGDPSIVCPTVVHTPPMLHLDNPYNESDQRHLHRCISRMLL